MKAVCILLFLGCGLTAARAQQRTIDSLENLLRQNPQLDTVRLNFLNDLSYEYYFTDPDKGLKRANEAIELAVRLQQTKKLAAAYQHKGHNYSAKGQDSLAMDMYNKAIVVHKKAHNPKGEAKAIFNKGLVYFGWADYKRSTECYLKAYSVFEEKRDSVLMAKMLNSMGINYMYMSDYPKALSKYLTAKKIYEKMGKTKGLFYASTLNNIGILYKNLEKPTLSLKHYQKALALYKKLDNKKNIAGTLSNIGNLYDDMGQSEKAVELNQQAYQIYKSINDKRGMASGLTNMAIALSALSQYDRAMEYLNQTKTIYEELGDLQNLSIVHTYLAQSYMAVLKEGQSHKENLKKAVAHNKTALKYAEKTGSLWNQNDVWEQLANAYTQMGDFKNALEAKTHAIALKDSIHSSEKKEEIARLEMQYEYDKKEAIINAEHEKKQVLARAQLQREKFIRYTATYGGSGLLLLTLGGLFLYKRKRDAVSRQKEAEFKAHMAEVELKALRAQMNPHFIYNSLNSIGDFFAKNDAASANKYLAKFAKLMRYTLENSEKKSVVLADDLGLLELYLEIEAKRMNHKFSYEIRVDKALDATNILVPPLILQPFIENSIWHGISKKEGKGHILIEIKKEGTMINCIVDDDGVGRQTSIAIEPKETKSMGVKITKSRIAIINKQKNAKGNVSIIDKANNTGLRIEVKLPLEQAF